MEIRTKSRVMKENFLPSSSEAEFGQIEPRGKTGTNGPLYHVPPWAAAFSWASVVGIHESFLVEAKH